MSAPTLAVASPSRPAPPQPTTLLGCGILAGVLYLVMMGAIRYPGYSWVSQVVSELSAVGAPTRQLWFWLGWVYTALTLAFGWGVWKTAPGNRALRVVGGLILASTLLGFVWPFAPMHQRAVLAAGGGTFGDTMHIVLSFVTVPLFMLTIGFGAAAFGKRFRVYSLATLLLLIVSGVFVGMQGADIAANLPTPTVGLWERINIAGYMLWVVVLAIAVMRARGVATAAPARAPLSGATA